MTFDELETRVFKNIACDLAVMSDEVTKLLNELNHEDIFVVRHLAKDISEVIANELALEDSDMVTIIRTLSAARDLMIAWLGHYGHNGRSLRHVTPNMTKVEIERQARYGSRSNAPTDNEKAPGGKFSYGDVRNIIYEVATNPGLGRQTARNVLDKNGRGAKKVSSLKPEDLDMVYEACQSLLGGESARGDAEQNPHVEQSVGNLVRLREWRLRTQRGNASNRDRP